MSGGIFLLQENDELVEMKNNNMILKIYYKNWWQNTLIF